MSNSDEGSYIGYLISRIVRPQDMAYGKNGKEVMENGIGLIGH